MILKTALFCYALTAYREARGQEVAAQIAAMQILQNRATLNRTPVCKELAKHRQFAWVRKYGITQPNPRGELDKVAWQQSLQLAKSVQILNVKGITKKHTYFNTVALGKRYRTDTKLVKIGDLLFY
jgi:hypothetical protein